MHLINKLTNSGISYARDASDQRNIIVTNYVALVFFSIYILSVIIRLAMFQMPIDWTVPSTLTLFLLPIVMNHFGLVKFSRIYLSWMPTIWVVMGFSANIKVTLETAGALYDGLRIYFLGFSCIPFLLVSPKNKIELSIALLVPAVMIIFCDPVLNFFHLGYSFASLSNFYTVNNMRSTISFLLIGGSCFSLKWLVERGEEKNEKLIKALAEKNEIIQKQAREELLEANKQISDSKLMALRAAMNPHFIFNTLNSIQFFIMKKDQLNAINYLSTFSKLIRSILNNAVNSKIRLKDELDQLKYYVQLELLRFDNKFQFKIDIDPTLDVDEIEIPSMLIQPYIENAILHGLYNKRDDEGILSLRIKEINERVLFEIEDNGVGRAAAASFKMNLPLHKSLGTMLTEERLKLINAQSGVSSEIEDLKKNGEASGTRVKIWVKLNN
jgi:sensor histidine kinase YesM